MRTGKHEGKNVVQAKNVGLKSVELLAPAGGMEQLRAAIRFGADAVYLAADRFGMRQRAQNFTLDELPDAIAYAHARGVSVHVTLNTLMDADDIAALPSYCAALAEAGADAFIVSDLGALAVARRSAPGVDIHVSTQASVCNAEAARVWYSLGARRVVCAREMSVADIARMRHDVPDDLQLEAFVHGAMCVAYSGRCLLSAAMTGRSGNKGHCSQSCRWSYELVEEKRPGEYYTLEQDARGSYVLNAKDLNMLCYLDDLACAGVSSFKIEGRNKKAAYVATVVHAYRQVMDGADPAEAEADLYAISHRPYGTGFYFGEPDQTLERDGYVKECLHVATVTSCEPMSDSATAYTVTTTCHNRFYEGQVVELVTPSRPIERFTVSGLHWLPTPTDDHPNLRAQAVDVANRAMDSYSFTSPIPCEPGDFLRVRIEDSQAG
ncbi:U32 family peptidase [Adlercreutzia sp. ZJ138]|uniref:peptidase U32 family protein n=1 Tax=Adlercreutzia sp. ZJ138 TaxID=2709405 RepID=UPI001F14A703|nr:U32 family peptidase [Adlercreutzia sp. ZJ138]